MDVRSPYRCSGTQASPPAHTGDIVITGDTITDDRSLRRTKMEERYRTN